MRKCWHQKSVCPVVHLLPAFKKMLFFPKRYFKKEFTIFGSTKNVVASAPWKRHNVCAKNGDKGVEMYETEQVLSSASSRLIESTTISQEVMVFVEIWHKQNYHVYIMAICIGWV